MLNQFYRRFGKRMLDLAIAVPVVLLASPILIALWVMVRVKLGGPVIFRQERPGRNGEPFTMCKFRTMTDARDADGNPLPDDQRMHPFGSWLRNISLDELPEIWNVLKGEMSLVGPRPLLLRYLDRYTPEQARRHEVRPGVTGWAQVNGRNQLSWEEKFALDVWYVDNLSLSLDLKILFLTAFKVFRRDGVAADGHATAPEFQGTAAGELKAASPHSGGDRQAA